MHGHQAAEVLYTDDVVAGRCTGYGVQFVQFTRSEIIPNAQHNYFRPYASRHNAFSTVLPGSRNTRS